MIYDLIVAGAGPAGSTAAREAAAAGANVLLLDRAEFPRDKPCGGGVNIRAAKLLPFDLAPVTERTVTGLSVSLDLAGDFVRRFPRPLCYMTQRSRLDAYLVERAVAAGARLLEGENVRSVEPAERTVLVRTRGASYQGRVLVGADGAKGMVAQPSGLSGGRRLAVAIEGNLPFDGAIPGRWQETLAMDLGLIPGGYGWLFPKGDHLNLGVGGWQHFGPELRCRLDRLTRHFGFTAAALRNLRGHHLPIRLPGAPLARGRVLLAGDAAGLIDPLSGEGIYAAIWSGRQAAAQTLRLLEGAIPDLRPYARAVERTLAPELLASQRFQDVFHLMPSAYVWLLRHSDRVWDTLCGLVRGEQSYLGLRRRVGPLAQLTDLLSLAIRSTPLRQRVGLPQDG
ncbi:MAG: geranylgeranyl reductase family protein [Dehalococcoidia bacterium]